jgi:uroporphyrinogen decarboxylase
MSEAIRLLTAELGTTPLIGFAGAPFTLATYLVEGDPSKTHEKSKAMMYTSRSCGPRCSTGRPPSPRRSSRSRSRPVPARFSSSTPGPGRSRPPTTSGTCCRRRPACSGRSHRTGVPMIHFGVGAGELLNSMGAAGADVVGSTGGCPLTRPLLGSVPTRRCRDLDPAVLFAPADGQRSPRRRAPDTGAHLQPRPRRPAVRQPGHAGGAGRVRPRGVPERLTPPPEANGPAAASIRRPPRPGRSPSRRWRQNLRTPLLPASPAG